MLIPHDLEELLGTLAEFSLIVEGKRDKQALNNLGFDDVADISGNSLDIFVSKLPEDKNYVILTDFDTEGEKKKSIISKLFEKNKIKFNPILRKKFRDFFKVSKIEELIKISKLKEDVFHGKISTINYQIFDRSKFHRKWYSREARRNWSYFWSD